MNDKLREQVELHFKQTPEEIPKFLNHLTERGLDITEEEQLKKEIESFLHEKEEGGKDPNQLHEDSLLSDQDMLKEDNLSQ